jgi:S-DNA-T family DNA segregation ATPase FtsK/SpoIIIE
LAKSTLQKNGKAAIQFYLLDLKKGVEVKPYENWPNVTIAKDEVTSLKILKALVKEMNRRYQLLEKRNKGEKIIVPEVHKRDIIVLAIDEASVLFGKTSNKVKTQIVNECRDAFDELCKLARASGIHIIAATQKPVKDSLDSRSIENLAGRIVFKMASNAGSILALGNGMATKLPDVKGRCIWRNGNQFEEIQAPYLSEEQVLAECSLLADEFKKEKNGNYQTMLDFDKEVKESQEKFNECLQTTEIDDEEKET